MESWFPTLKKEKNYQLDTTKMTVEEDKTIVCRYTFCVPQHKTCDNSKSGRQASDSLQGMDSSSKGCCLNNFSAFRH